MGDMTEVLTLVMALIPLIMILVIVYFIQSMFRSTLRHDVKESYVSKLLGSIVTKVDKDEMDTQDEEIEEFLDVLKKSSTLCKNCKTNKAVDDGFGLCQVCKEDPGWWMT